MKTWKKYAIYGIFFTENTTENQFCPKDQKNFFESGGFAMGRSGYLKHEYSFAPPKEKYTVNGLRLQANVASAVLTHVELDCSTGLILNVNM